jgi:hypothetical protein
MRDQKVHKDHPQKDEPVVEKVVSPKRVAIASIICIVATGTVIWALSQATQKIVDSSVLAVEKPSTVQADVRLPQKGDASYMIQEAQKNFREFSFDEYTATGSAARTVIDTLQDLQQSEIGIEDYFCKIFCN